MIVYVLLLVAASILLIVLLQGAKEGERRLHERVWMDHVGTVDEYEPFNPEQMVGIQELLDREDDDKLRAQRKGVYPADLYGDEEGGGSG